MTLKIPANPMISGNAERILQKPLVRNRAMSLAIPHFSFHIVKMELQKSSLDTHVPDDELQVLL